LVSALQFFGIVLAIAVAALPWHIPGFPGEDLSRLEFQPWCLELSGLAPVLIGIWCFRATTPATPMDHLPAPLVIPPSGGFTS
jgi:hypothetical protein